MLHAGALVALTGALGLMIEAFRNDGVVAGYPNPSAPCTVSAWKHFAGTETQRPISSVHPGRQYFSSP